MSKLVTIFGGSGFVGRYIARRMAKAGWRVRVAVRRPNEAIFVKPYGVVGQVEPVLCNIRDEASVRAALAGADAAVNCVGTFDKGGKNNFDAVQHEGAARIARLSAEEGVSRLVHISAIGADPDGASAYAQSKAAGEAAVLEAMPSAVILRPSVIFGQEDGFFNRFANMARISPFLPLFGASTKFQPVYVDNVAEAAEKAILGDATAGVYELGGPDVATFRSLMDMMLAVINRRSVVLALPLWVGRVMGNCLDWAQILTGGLFQNSLLTKDQALSLASDNIVADDARTLADLGVTPVAMQAVLPEYLWSFRPDGQYNTMIASAKNLTIRDDQ